ncbi:hypothetical protein GQ600_15905 [Phytophthora cactorum]|nr:hypothetical protein GQ600_15905 [Phytophthora cactorum]
METYNGRVANDHGLHSLCQERRRLQLRPHVEWRPGPERVPAMKRRPRSLRAHLTLPARRRPSSQGSRILVQPKTRRSTDPIVCDDSDQVTLGQRRAAFLVLEQLLLIDQKEAQVQADKTQNFSALRQPTEAAKRAMDVSKCRKDLDACKFASADSRPYPMMPALIQNEEGSKEVEPEPIITPSQPTKTNGWRLSSISAFTTLPMFLN